MAQTSKEDDECGGDERGEGGEVIGDAGGDRGE